MFSATLLTLGSRAIMALVKVITSIVIVRSFGAAGQGMYAVALNVSVMAGLVGSAGLEVANAYDAGRRPEWTRSLILQSTIAATVAGAVLGLALWTAFPTLNLFDDFDPGYRTLLAVSAAPPILTSLLSGIAVGAANFRLLATANVILYSIVLASSLIGSVAGAPLVPFTGWIVGNLAAAMLLTLRLWHRFPGRVQLRQTGLRDRLRFSSGAYVANLVNWLNFRLDLLIVASLLGPVAAGAYAVATTLAEGLLYLAKSVAQPLLSQVVRERRSWSRPALRPYRLVIGATAGGAVLVALVSPALIDALYGRQMSPAVPALALLAVAMPSMAFVTLAWSHLFGLRRPRPALAAAAVAGGIAVVLDLLFVPRFGITAAAGAAIVAYGTAALILARSLRSGLEPAPRWNDFTIPGVDDAKEVGRRLRAMARGTVP